jgi:signal transduction histidine kinase
VSRQLAELMGGTLSYSFRTGFSTFELCLPAAR